MQEQNLYSTIHNIGFISTVPRYGKDNQISTKESSAEDYVGKITALFAPYILQNITDGKFCGLQNELKKVVCEIRGSR